MPTSSVGRANNALTGRQLLRPGNSVTAGITLIELLVVVAIASLIVSVSFPAVTSGIDSLRLNSACNGVVSFLNTALSRAERHEQVVEVTVSKSDNALTLRSSDPGFTRRFAMPQGVTITKIVPEPPEETDGPRVFMLYPGGTVPPFGLVLTNTRHTERLVQVDAMTGVAIIGPPQS